MAAVGNAVGFNTFISSGNTLIIQPLSGSNVEWVIHNFYLGDSANVSKTDGQNPVTFAQTGGSTWLQNAQVHVTFSSWVTIKSTSTSNYPYAWDGIRFM